jgi:hypothetical protein
MAYRFSLTPRLVTLGLVSLVALLVLMFLLGMQIGQRLAPVRAPAAQAQPAQTAQAQTAQAQAQAHLDRMTQGAAAAVAPPGTPLGATLVAPSIASLANPAVSGVTAPALLPPSAQPREVP